MNVAATNLRGDIDDRAVYRHAQRPLEMRCPGCASSPRRRSRSASPERAIHGCAQT